MPEECWNLGGYNLARKRVHLVGRSSECDVQLDNASVSAKHAVIVFIKRDNFICPMVADLRSTRGTFVNGDKVSSDLLELKAGDELRFGKDTGALTLARGSK